MRHVGDVRRGEGRPWEVGRRRWALGLATLVACAPWGVEVGIILWARSGSANAPAVSIPSFGQSFLAFAVTGVLTPGLCWWLLGRPWQGLTVCAAATGLAWGGCLYAMASLDGGGGDEPEGALLVLLVLLQQSGALLLGAVIGGAVLGRLPPPRAHRAEADASSGPR